MRVSWRLDPPFSISPQAGTLAPGETVAYDVAFLPQEAGSFSGGRLWGVCGMTGLFVVRVGVRELWASLRFGGAKVRGA